MIYKIISSFKNAFDGICYTINTQLNFRIEMLAVLVLIVTYFQLDITITEWMIVLMSLGFVLAAELINTALEVTCDLISLKYNLQIKNIKDVAAGSVLLCLFVVVGINSIVLYHNLPIRNLF
jgi:diacylglycerol kinase